MAVFLSSLAWVWLAVSTVVTTVTLRLAAWLMTWPDVGCLQAQVDFTEAFQMVIQQQNALSEQMAHLQRSVQQMNMNQQQAPQTGSQKGSRRSFF